MSQLWSAILLSAGRTFADRWRALFHALLLPICLQTFLGLITPREPVPLLLLWVAAQLSVSVALAVTAHRIILLGLDLPAWAAVSWSERETRFLGWALVSGGLMAVSVLPLSIRELIESPLIWMLTTPVQVMAFILGTRLSLMLPAIAVGDSATPGAAWALSRGSSLQVVFALALPFFAFEGLWLLVPEDAALLELTTVQVLLGLVGGLTTTFEITVLSVCYRELKSRQGAPAAA